MTTVPPEGPADHIRNALAILEPLVSDLSPLAPLDARQTRALRRDLVAVAGRLWRAIGQLEAPKL